MRREEDGVAAGRQPPAGRAERLWAATSADRGEGRAAWLRGRTRTCAGDGVMGWFMGSMRWTFDALVPESMETEILFGL